MRYLPLARSVVLSLVVVAASLTSLFPAAAISKGQSSSQQQANSATTKEAHQPVFERQTQNKVTKTLSRSAGGSIASKDGKVRIDVPANASDFDLEVTFTPIKRWTWGSAGMRLVTMFELTAHQAGLPGMPVSHFDKDVNLTIQLTEKYYEQDLGGFDVWSWQLVHYDETEKAWAPTGGAVSFSQKRPRLAAATKHFSIFGSQAAPIIAGPGIVMGFQNDLHGGAATAAIPLEAPPGPNGFGPVLNLQYNSGSVDEMKNKRDVGSWVGMGWSLSLGSVNYNAETGKYFLSLNGTSYELVADPGSYSESGCYEPGSYSMETFHTKPESYFKIVRYKEICGITTWRVWDREGTFYRFGQQDGDSASNANQGTQEQYFDSEVGCITLPVVIHRYHLAYAKDVDGNEFNVVYSRDLAMGGGSGNCPARNDHVSAYPLDISYGKNANVGGSAHRFNVHFDLSSDTNTGSSSYGWVRNDNPGGTSGYARIRENKRLDSVEMKLDSDGNGTFETLVRRYNLSYTTTAAGTSTPYAAGEMTLNSLTQVGADGSSTLPATTFTYADQATYFYNPGQSQTSDPCNPCNPAQFTWPHLSKAENGYGGTVSYTYTSKPDPAGSPQNLWVRAVVTERGANPGIGTLHSLTYAYTGDPKYHVPDANNHWLDEYRGFAQVRETDAASHYSDHWYYTTGIAPDGKDGEKLTGKEYQTEWRSSSATLLRKTENDWEWDWTCCSSPYTQRTYFVRLEQTDTTIGSKVGRTRFTYDSYGSVARENRDGDTGTSSDDATVFYDYTRNTSANILNTVKLQKFYSGNKSSDDGTNLKAETYFFYDGNNSDNQLSVAPSRGNLTRLKQATTVGSSYISTYSTYDSYGNKASEQDPNGSTRTWTYDSTYHNLPVTETYPAIGGSSMSESATWDPAAGVMLTWTDVNSVQTAYEYDTFKRLTKVVRDGDSSSYPTLAYTYNSWGLINVQNLETVVRLTPGSGGTTRSSKQLFDGLGRVVQVQSDSESGGYTMVEGTTLYNTRGLVDKSYVPQKVNGVLSASSGRTVKSGGWTSSATSVQTDAAATTIKVGHTLLVDSEQLSVTAVSGDTLTVTRGVNGTSAAAHNAGVAIAIVGVADAGAAWRYTSYAYDAIGRVTTQTNPDETTVTHSYSDWQDSVTNPRGYKKRYSNDAFGRLLTVEEYNDSNPATVYATTTYTYDVLGNLTAIEDAAGNDTTMTYNALSRKTGMTDPDMGTWSYVYDSNGNLTSQTDAKSQTISMTYDALNRITAKDYPAGTADVSYTYDSTASGNKGKGRLTSMTDGPGSAAYVYDARGRVTSETKVINSDSKTFTYTYDSADRQVTVTYPDSEVVTTTYNGRGLPSTLGNGTINFVSVSAYNALALTSLTFGNGVVTSYSYYGLEQNPSSASNFGRLYQVTAVKSGTTLQDMTHNWDANGNLSSRINSVGTSETESFSYDFLDRLTAVSNAYSESYAYNTIANITSKNGNSYTYGSSGHVHAVTAVQNGNSYSYDANGNMTARGSQTLTWDADNRLTAVTGVASYTYDGDGKRATKTESSETIAYYNKYYDKNLTTGVATKYYYFGGKLVAQKVGSDDLVYFHQDHLTGTSVLSDNAGASLGTIKYYPFGGTRSTSGSLPTDKKFTGQRLDGTGLYFYNARYYDPEIGRFVSADTIVANSENPQDLNRYSYCLNGPTVCIDPTGHAAIQSRGPGDNYDRGVFYPKNNPANDLYEQCVTSGCSGPRSPVTPPRSSPNSSSNSNKSSSSSAKGSSAAPAAPAPSQAPRPTDPPKPTSTQRTPPNPNGMVGKPPHQNVVQQVGQTFQEMGYTVDFSRKINTPGGHLPYRLPDITVYDSQGKIVGIYQVGRSTVNGSPILREVRAMADINAGLRDLGYNLQVVFFHYD